MARGDPDTVVDDLLKADRKVARAASAYTEATTERTKLILDASNLGLSRSMIARRLDVSPNRVQQILDRAQARRSRET